MKVYSHSEYHQNILDSIRITEFGVPVAASELARFGEVQTLVVTRFDRKLDASKKFWLRLPQEDFCQVTGRPSSSKYEVDGGPGLVEMARILNASDAREADKRTPMQAQLLFWMLAAIDGHAKNFSIHLLPQGHFRLTPLYDVLGADMNDLIDATIAAMPDAVERVGNELPQGFPEGLFQRIVTGLKRAARML